MLIFRRKDPDVHSLEYCVAVYQAHGSEALRMHLSNQFTTEHLNKLCRELNLPLSSGTMNNIIISITRYAEGH